MLTHKGDITLGRLSKILTESIAEEAFFDYVQFSGHGVDDPLATVVASGGGGPGGATQRVVDAGLAETFAAYQKHSRSAVRGVILNCCHSFQIAQKLYADAGVPVAIGCAGKLSDAGAIRFSQAFYDGVASNPAAPRVAFDFAVAQLKSAGCDDNYRLAPTTATPAQTPAPARARVSAPLAAARVAAPAPPASKPGWEWNRDKLVAYYYEADARRAAPAYEGRVLRPYQRELAESCVGRNALVVLPTGAGKTIVAFELMERAAARGGGRKVAFLAQTVPLVFQQGNACRRFSSMAVGKYCGDENRLDAEYANVTACFFTAGLFLNLLQAGRVAVDDFSLLVFDEAHHAKKQHPYVVILRDFWARGSPRRPTLLGLSASPAEAKSGALEDTVAKVRNVLAALGDAALVVPGAAGAASLASAVRTPAIEFVCVARLAALDDHLGLVAECLAARGLPNKDGAPYHAYARTLDGVVAADKAERALVDVLVDLVAAVAAFEDFGESAAVAARGCFKRLREAAPAALGARAADLEAREPAILADLADLASPTKFDALEELLADALAASPRGKALVFVEERATAEFVAASLSDALAPRHSAVHVVGHAGGGGMTTKEQERIVGQFRDATDGPAVLVATAVCEEGIDVGACGLVVRFDRASTTTAVIQSRGRARAEGGRLVLFTENRASAEREAASLREREETMQEAVDIVAGVRPPTPPTPPTLGLGLSRAVAATRLARALSVGAAGASGARSQRNFLSQLNELMVPSSVAIIELPSTAENPFCFSILVRGVSIGEPGYGPSKRKAKHAAAEKFFNTLRAMPLAGALDALL